MDVADDGKPAQVELRLAAHGHGIEAGRDLGHHLAVGGRNPVLAAIAVIGEGVVALAVVVLDAGEIGGGGRDQLLPRQPLVRRHRLIVGGRWNGRLLHVLHAEVVPSGRGALTVEHRLHLGDLAQLHPQSDGHQEGRLRLALLHHAFISHLAALQIHEDLPVLPDAAGSVPETVALRHALAELGVFHVGGERQARGIVCDQGAEVLVHQALVTGAVAVQRDVCGLSGGPPRCHGHDRQRHGQSRLE